ncbi:MAG: hypothetical protein HN842_04565 [Gammaproteobacteria bacterium]|jgi:hypothetical protein|nr:hypothetical protein [Gammaproteobacteria bacterium]
MSALLRWIKNGLAVIALLIGGLSVYNGFFTNLKQLIVDPSYYNAGLFTGSLIAFATMLWGAKVLFFNKTEDVGEIL